MVSGNESTRWPWWKAALAVQKWAWLGSTKNSLYRNRWWRPFAKPCSRLHEPHCLIPAAILHLAGGHYHHGPTFKSQFGASGARGCLHSVYCLRKAKSSGGVDGAEGVWGIKAAEKPSVWSMQVREIHLDFLLPSLKPVRKISWATRLLRKSCLCFLSSATGLLQTRSYH